MIKQYDSQDQRHEVSSYLYTYACHEDERELCALELKRLLDTEPQPGYVETPIAISPERSPFVHYRLDIQWEAHSLEALEQLAVQINVLNEREDADLPTFYSHGDEALRTFKLLCLDAQQTFSYEEKRQLERRIGMCIHGKAQMKQPQLLFGMAYSGGRWVLGRCYLAESVWLQHNDKPRHYSTALSTRVARAAVNIALPHPTGRTLIDPCCGIGTVLVEALSMNIDIVGYDLNPLAVQGARENLQHYGMPNIVSIGDLRQLKGSYDALILDLPYNLCSVLEEDERLHMLQAAARLAHTQLVISTENIANSLAEAGLTVQHICHLHKGKFTRYLWLCSYQF
ncbi:TRM11 family SAM-dependent methyltransferase [Paenibacillus sp. WLX1005]|uniref:TRM11 family SAM-dependent methyltransferase n=1 Tax=Paenibacillus sp. WLX1005 TaxID=3243766 RepID=UPI0039844551